MNGKVQQCEEGKNEYAAQLQTYNNHQTEFFSQSMPQVFQVGFAAREKIWRLF